MGQAIPYLIKGGFDLLSAKMGADAQSKSADKQAEAIEKGIDLQKQMYEQDRADLSGYRALGNGAIGNLAYLWGINLPPPDAAPAANPNAVPPLTLSNIGADPNGNSPSTHVLQTSMNGVNQANAAMNSGQLGPTTKVTKNGVTRVIPTSLLGKARSEGYQEVAG